MKRIIIGSILFVVFAVIGFIGASTILSLLIYELFWGSIWGFMIYKGYKSLGKTKDGSRYN